MTKESAERKLASTAEKKASQSATTMGRVKSSSKDSSSRMSSTKQEDLDFDDSDAETLQSDFGGAGSETQIKEESLMDLDDLSMGDFSDNSSKPATAGFNGADSKTASRHPTEGADSKTASKQYTEESGSSRKRGSNPSSQTESKERKRPKSTQGGFKGIATDGGILSFAPGDRQPSYVPRTLVAPSSSKQAMIVLPVVIQLDGETIQLEVKSNPGEGDKCFWTELNGRVKQLETVLAEPHFGAISQEELDQLRVGSSLLPKLLGQDGRLQYEVLAKGDRVNKQDYKKFIEVISSNADRMKARYQYGKNEAT
ncbi:hypothetical protein HO173_003236 [Letharia columbiana]|uniref:Uncharacterized protein n=1 Tax=Letharia columbiana TaxID=112416 RepID=A0A8H6G1M5_9LECA|nr:uncharacterized protein HO173_003236 [Letharia columbiana]KAF6238730.1 hypothetical protein HO173_003236 [Letharia columbiana]